MSNRTRVRGFASWSPRSETLVLLAQVRAVLIEYAAYLPLTVRQIFYRLVGAAGYPKSETAYGRLCETLNRARRAGLIRFDAIRDDGTILREPSAWDGAGEMVRAFIANAEGFRLDRQTGQPRRLLFAIEAAGMVPQIERVTAPFGIAVHSSGGFDSLTAKHDLARMLAGWGSAEVLHIGDHDPSGVHLFMSMAEDVRALASEGDIGFARLAVTPEQIEAMGLPTAPAKATDRRAFDGETVQAEAIRPDVLAGIVRQAIESRLDRAAYSAVLAEEETIRTRLMGELVPVLQAMDPDGAE